MAGRACTDWGRTQQTFAEAIGVEPVSVSRFETGERAMSLMHQRAGGLEQMQSVLPRPLTGALGGAVGRDDDRGGGHSGDLVLDVHSLSAKRVENHIVMHQVAQDRDWLCLGLAESQGDCIADAETHAEMGSANYIHGTKPGDQISLRRLTYTLHCKVKDHIGPVAFKLQAGLRFADLLDNLFQEVDVGGKRLSAGGGQSEVGLGSAALKCFGYGQIPCFLQGPDVRGDVPVRHAQRVAHLGKGELGGGAKEGEDGQASLLMDHSIQLQERFWIHASGLRCSVK